MAEQMSMDDILSDAPQKPAEKPAPAEAPAPEAAAPQEQAHKPESSLRKEHQRKEFEAQGRDPDTGQFVKKDEPAPSAAAPAKPEAAKAAAPAAPAAPAQEEYTPKEKAAFAKAADETRKRQALEVQLRELQARMPAAPAAPAEQPKAFWDDPEGTLKRHEQAVQQAVQHAAIGSRLQTSEVIARSRYPDFEEKVGKFKDLVMTTAGLAQQMLSAADPAEFAYRTAANHMAIEQAGGVDALIAKAREEERAKVRVELEAELKAKADALAKDRAALPGSLSDAPSRGSNRPVWGGPTSFKDILNG